MGVEAGRLSSTCALLAVAFGATPGSAQIMREYEAARPVRDERLITVNLEFAAGGLRLMPGPAGTLYRLESRYDTERFAPVSIYDSQSGRLTLGLRSTGAPGLRVTSRKHLDQQATVWLSPEVELALVMTLGAAESRIDLGGLRLRDLLLRAGGSRTRLVFSRPGLGVCREAVLEAGAGELVVDRFANAGCRRLRLNGGVGLVTIDFGGQPDSELSADLGMTMGELTLRLPHGAGVRLTLDRFLASFQPAGFTRQGEQFVTPDYDKARRRIDLRVSTAVGAVKVEWY
jgi:hypothetical protein